MSALTTLDDPAGVATARGPHRDLIVALTRTHMDATRVYDSLSASPEQRIAHEVRSAALTTARLVESLTGGDVDVHPSVGQRATQGARLLLAAMRAALPVCDVLEDVES